MQDAMPTMKPGTCICITVMAYSPAFAVRPEYCARDNPKCSGSVIDTVGGASIVVRNSSGGAMVSIKTWVSGKPILINRTVSVASQYAAAWEHLPVPREDERRIQYRTVDTAHFITTKLRRADNHVM